MSWYEVGPFPDHLKLIYIIMHIYYSHKVVEHSFSPFARLYEFFNKNKQAKKWVFFTAFVNRFFSNKIWNNSS